MGKPEIEVKGADPKDVIVSCRRGCPFFTRIRYIKETASSLAYRH